MAAQSRTPRKTLISNEYCCAPNCLCITTTYSFTDLLSCERCYAYSLFAIKNIFKKVLNLCVFCYILTVLDEMEGQFKIWNDL